MDDTGNGSTFEVTDRWAVAPEILGVKPTIFLSLMNKWGHKRPAV